MARRLLIRGAFVISMDRDVGDLLPGAGGGARLVSKESAAPLFHQLEVVARRDASDPVRSQRL